MWGEMRFLLLLAVLLAVSEIPLSSSTPELHRICSNRFRCGEIVADFPFWGGDQRPRDCGHPALELQCENNGTTIIEIAGVRYKVLEILHQTKKLKIAREDYEGGICPLQEIQNTTLDAPLFDSLPRHNMNITLLYGCPGLLKANFSCSSSKGLILPGVSTDSMGCLSSAIVPVQFPVATFTTEKVIEALQSGFEVKWKVDQDQVCEKCLDSKGKCGTGLYNATTCYCPEPSTSFHVCRPPLDSISPPPTSPAAKNSVSTKTILGTITGLAVVAIIVLAIWCVLLIICRRPKALYSFIMSLNLTLTKMKNDERVEAFILQYSSLAPKRYSYSDIKKMTKSFKDKLGQGGYGTVYKGILPDGRIVAVKLLGKSKGDGQDFINEVASISRTSHINIVTLLGFCYERSKRALIYEFMPNGSLDKFIYNQQSGIPVKTLYEIALGIARGLEYLHKGCNTRILHFDMKPHNILLDSDFCPKIADFGLAKSYETRESIVSMTGARGTCGYIAPEVFCREIGGVSYKSDVYSYGMMVLEMVGGRKNVNVEVENTSEIYFPTWLYKQLEKAERLKLNGVELDEEEEETTRKMTIVGLWCIQTVPSDRPSMTKVLEMLQGNLEALTIPPRLYSSPVRSPPQDLVNTCRDEACQSILGGPFTYEI